MPPCQCLSRSLVAVASELVHRWETPLVNFAVAPRGKREEHKNMMLQTANHWTEHLNWSLPARCRAESRQCRRRTIRNKVVRAASAIASGRPKAKRRPPSPLNLFSLKHDMIGHIPTQQDADRY